MALGAGVVLVFLEGDGKGVSTRSIAGSAEIVIRRLRWESDGT